jgi:hypothetical protein
VRLTTSVWTRQDVGRAPALQRSLARWMSWSLPSRPGLVAVRVGRPPMGSDRTVGSPPIPSSPPPNHAMPTHQAGQWGPRVYPMRKTPGPALACLGPTGPWARVAGHAGRGQAIGVSRDDSANPHGRGCVGIRMRCSLCWTRQSSADPVDTVSSGLAIRESRPLPFLSSMDTVERQAQIPRSMAGSAYVEGPAPRVPGGWEGFGRPTVGPVVVAG